MKNIFACAVFFFALSVFSIAFAQVKIMKATVQKRFDGMGGISSDYFIAFKSRSNESIEADSVKAIVDTSEVKFGFKTLEPCCKYQVAFSSTLVKPAKCGTCPDVSPALHNFTKGVIVYYKKKGEAKCLSFKVKKFKKLPELRMP